MKYFRNIIITGALLFLSMSFPALSLAVESCGGTCPGGIGEGDAALGVNFTGLQPSDLSKGSFVVEASNGGGFSCDYGGGTAGNTSSCTARYNSANPNIECLIEHLDCRNGAFNISVNAPAGYSCSASPTSKTLANCSDNSPVTVSCTPPAPICATSCGACPGQTTCGNWTYDTCDISPCSAAGATASTTFTCHASGNTGCSFTYQCNSCAPAPVDGSECTAISVNSGNAVTSGQSYPATVSMKNPTGNYNTWTTAASYNLGSSNPRDNTVWGRSRVALPSTTTPGNTAKFDFTVTAPSVTSQTTKTFDWEMVKDGTGGNWFGAQCQYNVTVNPPLAATPLDVPPCTARDASGNIITSATTGQAITWRGEANGGTANFTYTWSGTDSLSGSTTTSSRTNTISKTYTTAGTKNANVTVRDSSSPVQEKSTNCSVTITDPFAYSLKNGGDRSVTQGSSTTNTITANLDSGTSQLVNLSVSPCPSGVTCSLSPTSGNPTYLSTLTMAASSTATTGTSLITVTGTSAGLSNRLSTLNLTVNPTGTLAVPTVTLSASPTNIISGSSTTLTWTITGTATSCAVSNSGTPPTITSGDWTTPLAGSDVNSGPHTRPITMTTTTNGAVKTFNITCTNSGANSSPANAQVTVNTSGSPCPTTEGYSCSTSLPGSNCSVQSAYTCSVSGQSCYFCSPPAPPTVDTSAIPNSCIDPGYSGSGVTISWTNSGVTWVDISRANDSSFTEPYYHKSVSSVTSTTGPSGFGSYCPSQPGGTCPTGTPANLTLNPATTYYVRTYISLANVHSQNATISPILACIATCSGNILLTLTPSTVNASTSVNATASGLTNCNNIPITITKNSPTGTPVAGCTSGTAGCTTSFTAPSTANTYTYFVCIDKNNDNNCTDAGESTSSNLVVNPAGTAPPPCAWIQTTGGDVHSNTRIYMSCGP